jgi:hypothetical protein
MCSYKDGDGVCSEPCHKGCQCEQIAESALVARDEAKQQKQWTDLWE